MTPINSLGYGIAGINILKALEPTLDVCLFPIGPPDVSTEQDMELVDRTASKNQSSEASSPCLKIWHEFGMYERIGRGKFFGFPFFEITKFNEGRKTSLRYTDHTIVASRWAANVIADQVGNLPVSVVPLGVDRTVFNEIGNQESVSQEKFTFFNCGKWELRKGHDILLKMFQAAFPFETDVGLSMMTHNPFLNEAETREWETYYSSDSRVELIPRKGTVSEVAQEMKKAHCGIFPSRAEGWNLELLEMMSCGKPVIATNYSAHTEYCNPDNCMLIDINKLEPANDNKWFRGDVGDWASLEVDAFDQTVHYMRSIYRDWSEGKDIENVEAIKTAKALSWEAAAEKIKSIIFDSGEEKQ
jgi:glycosyltransferase involved in cell wall biosynthesis